MSQLLIPDLPAAVMTTRASPAPGALIGEMAGGIAHDFRNVLAVLRSALDLTERHLGDPGRARQMLASARLSIDRGIDLTARLLALARPHDVELRRLRICDLIRDFSPFLRYALAPRYRLGFQLDDSMPSCLVEPNRFNAALLNLVVNARDAMPDGGEIMIESGLERHSEWAVGEEAQDWIRVSVRDEGPGMSEDMVARIFEPWFTTKGDTGTGLGLPQVLAFLEIVRGRLAVRTRPGGGTTFDLFLPVPPVPVAAQLARQIDRWVNEGGSHRGWVSRPE